MALVKLSISENLLIAIPLGIWKRLGLYIQGVRNMYPKLLNRMWKEKQTQAVTWSPTTRNLKELHLPGPCYFFWIQPIVNLLPAIQLIRYIKFLQIGYSLTTHNTMSLNDDQCHVKPKLKTTESMHADMLKVFHGI